MRYKHNYIVLVVLLNLSVKAQIIFINNPANHIVAYNPAFSGVQPYFNKNYSSNQVTGSYRASKNQRDVLASGQYFFMNQNIGVSAHYGFMDQNKYYAQKAGIGVSYQLLFFNEVSIAWGIALNYDQLKADPGIGLSVYSKLFSEPVKSAKSLSLNFGGLINYQRLLVGFSYQPKQVLSFSSDQKGTTCFTNTIYFKTYKPLTRRLNAILWYNASWNTISNLKTDSMGNGINKLQTHALHTHISGRKGIIGGLGCRLTNFNYASAIVKVGYNTKHWQVLYGIEPYWLNNKYSEIIHEFSFTYKFN